MEIFADGHSFMFMLGLARFEYAWNKKDNSVTLRSNEPISVGVDTNSGVFVEAVSPDGAVITCGGDGGWLRVPVTKDTVSLRYKPLPDPGLSRAAINKRRQKVQRILCSDMPYSLGVPDSLEGVIKWLSDKLNDIPEKCRKSAYLDYTDSWSHGELYPNWAIKYEEPETDAEVIRRVQVEIERQRIKEESERAKLRELQKKFGT